MSKEWLTKVKFGVEYGSTILKMAGNFKMKYHHFESIIKSAKLPFYKAYKMTKRSIMNSKNKSWNTINAILHNYFYTLRVQSNIAIQSN